MALTKYTIHKVGTPRLANDRGRLVSAGSWFQGTGWGDADNACVFDNMDYPLPPNGEWVEIYVNEEMENQ